MDIQDVKNIISSSGEIPDKCIDCGDYIIYPNTNVSLNKDGKLIVKGTSWRSQKIVNEKIYKLKICWKCLKKKFPKLFRLASNVMCEPTKYAYQIQDDDYISFRKKYAMSLSNMITKYGEELGKKKWEEYCERQAYTNTFEYKQKIYGWTREDFDNYNKKRAVTYENLIERHGEELGKKKWEEYVSIQQKTKSRDWMIEQYGVEKTNEINRSKIHNLENFIKRYGEELGKKKWEEYCENRSKPFSKAAYSLFKKFDKYLPKGLTSKHSENEHFVQGENQLYFLDYFIPELNICIEFNGDAWHGNPNIYLEEDRCHPIDKTITAKELQDKDKRRYDFLQNKYGIKTYIIWENESKKINAKHYIYDIINSNI